MKLFLAFVLALLATAINSGLAQPSQIIADGEDTEPILSTDFACHNTAVLTEDSHDGGAAFYKKQ